MEMPIPPFLALSEALMATLASRSHEWIDWEILEILRTESHITPITTDSRKDQAQDIFLKVRVEAQQRSMHLKEDASPSKIVSQILSGPFNTRIPELKDLGDARYASKPQETLEELQTYLDSTQISNWRIEAKLLKFRRKNSHGIFTEGAQSEISIFQGAKRVYSETGLNHDKLKSGMG